MGSKGCLRRLFTRRLDILACLNEPHDAAVLSQDGVACRTMGLHTQKAVMALVIR